MPAFPHAHPDPAATPEPDLYTQLVAARAALAQAEARASFYQQVFEQLPRPAMIISTSHYIDCNYAVVQLLGLESREQVIGQPLGVFSPGVQPDGRPTPVHITEVLNEALRLGWARFPWLGRRPSGEEFCESMLITVLPATDQVLFHVMWEESLLERVGDQAYRAGDDRLQLALAATNAGVWVSNLFTGTMHCDARLRELLGLAGPDITHDAFWRLVDPADQEAVDLAFEAAVREAHPFDVEFGLHHPTAGLRYVAAMGRVFYDAAGEPARMTGLMRDVTSRRLIQLELTQKTMLLEQLLGNLPLVLGRFSTQGQILELRGAGLHRVHMPNNAAVGRPVGVILRNLHAPIQQVLQGTPVSFVGEGEADGQPVYFQCFGFFDENQQCGVMLGADVTDSERMKNRLRTEKEFSESLLNHSLDAIVACDLQGRITAWNLVMQRLSGQSAAQMLGQPLRQHAPFTPDTIPGDTLGAMLTDLQPRYNVAFRCHDQDCEANFVPLTGTASHGVLIIIRDVTMRNRLAVESTRLHLRRQQEIMSAVLTAQEAERRRIAEGLHNGLGQLLYAAKLSLETPDQKATRALLEEAIRTTRTISFELTPGVLTDFGLRTALVELLKRIPPRSLHITMHWHQVPEQLPATIDIALYRISQELINNILKHARATEATLHLAYEAGSLLLSVEDNGVGFDAHRLAQAPVQGLGLASIRNRAELLSGLLTIDSRPGRGTIITITIPYDFPAAEKPRS